MIGIFDSGIGGLSLVRAVQHQLPQYRLLYFGDSARTPYGNKSLDTVRRYSEQLYTYLKNNGAAMIIVACNTSSAAAGTLLRGKNELPVFDVINASCTGALTATRTGSIAVLGTRATIASRAHEQELLKRDANIQVSHFPCPSLATLIEDTEVSVEALEAVVRSYVRAMDETVDSIILGCTHYPLIKSCIQKVVGETRTLIDPAQELVCEITRFLEQHPEVERSLERGSDHRFVVSDEADTFAQLTEKFLGKEYVPELWRW